MTGYLQVIRKPPFRACIFVTDGIIVSPERVTLVRSHHLALYTRSTPPGPGISPFLAPLASYLVVKIGAVRGRGPQGHVFQELERYPRRAGNLRLILVGLLVSP